MGDPSAATEVQDPGIHLRWEIVLGSGPTHVVEIVPGEYMPGQTFRCDGTTYKIGHVLGSAPRVTEFRIGQHPATMTMRVSTQGLAQAMTTAILAGAGTNLSSFVKWTIYELAVDGRSQGAFVATQGVGLVRGWTRIPPGDPLLDRWPDDPGIVPRPVAPPVEADVGPSIADRIFALERLRLSGSISEEEFTTRMDRILEEA